MGFDLSWDTLAILKGGMRIHVMGWLLWAGSAEIDGPLSLLDSPECVWLEWLFPV